MVEELVMKERLEGLQRILQAGHTELAIRLIECMKDEIDLKVEQFEQEVEGFYGS